MKRKVFFILLVVFMILSACRKDPVESTGESSLYISESERVLETGKAPETETVNETMTETNENDEVVILENEGDIVIEHPDDMDDDGF